MDDVRRRVVVGGRVQGVFFRDECRRRARELGLRGWVSNRPDGRVEIEAEGSPDVVDRLVDWARTGPPHAEVAGVEVTDLDPTGLPGFEVR
ncbi:acylphosphatase [soil metagenome]